MYMLSLDLRNFWLTHQPQINMSHTYVSWTRLESQNKSLWRDHTTPHLLKIIPRHARPSFEFQVCQEFNKQFLASSDFAWAIAIKTQNWPEPAELLAEGVETREQFRVS
jgi:hypothetical protein